VIDLRDALETEERRFHQDPGARERLLARRDRKRRNERLRAATLAIALSVAVVGALFLGARTVGIPAVEPSTAPNGRIVFARADSKDPEPTFLTYTANPDGSDVRQLPGGASYQPKPRWSPGGSEIALAEPRTSVPGCSESAICTTVIVNVDAGTVRGIQWPLPGTWDVDCFPWSPDGARLACGALDDNGTGLSGIYTINSSDGGDPKRITTGGETVPGDFSPDGRRLVFANTTETGDVGIFVVGLNGKGLRRITPTGMLLNNLDGGSWSATGDRIVFQARSAPAQLPTIWVVNADGTGLQEVRTSVCGGPDSDPGSAACRLPRWSPDGTRIIFSRRSSSQTTVSGIYSVAADGADPVRITNNGLGDTQPDWGTHPTTG
jgi:Tol biopolymer transport system component